jgi:hypothetical protein
MPLSQSFTTCLRSSPALRRWISATACGPNAHPGDSSARKPKVASQGEKPAWRAKSNFLKLAEKKEILKFRQTKPGVPLESTKRTKKGAKTKLNEATDAIAPWPPAPGRLTPALSKVWVKPAERKSSRSNSRRVRESVAWARTLPGVTRAACPCGGNRRSEATYLGSPAKTKKRGERRRKRILSKNGGKRTHEWPRINNLRKNRRRSEPTENRADAGRQRRQAACNERLTGNFGRRTSQTRHR